MAVGVFGITRPSDVDINDISIFYNYTPNRQTSNNIIYSINASEVLTVSTLPTDDPNYVAGNQNLLEGLYNLRLPATIFNALGVYTLYIKPKVITLTVEDCGVLSALPSVRGVVIKASDPLPQSLWANNALQGYKIEYLNNDATKTN